MGCSLLAIRCAYFNTFSMFTPSFFVPIFCTFFCTNFLYFVPFFCTFFFVPLFLYKTNIKLKSEQVRVLRRRNMSVEHILPHPNALTLDNFCSLTFNSLDTKNLRCYLTRMAGQEQKQKQKKMMLREIKQILHARRGNTSGTRCTYGCYECKGAIAKINTPSGIEFTPTSIWTSRSTKNRINASDLKSLAMTAATDKYLMNIVYKSR